MSNILDKIKLSGVTYDIYDSTAIHSMDGYWTSAQTESAITAATGALAETIAEELSGKVNTDTYTAYTAATEAVISGKLDTSIFQTYSGNTETVLASKFAGATWNSTDKKIYFYDNVSATGTALAYIDGTDFVKDGFLQSVTIENKVISGESVPCLVFIWNTDAGIQETDIPLSGIFDPTNYVSVATFTAYTASTDTVLAGKANTGDVVTDVGVTTTTIEGKNVYKISVTDGGTTSSYTYLIGGTGITLGDSNIISVDTNTIQEKLVSATNIKTINNESVLGSGNITIDTGNKVEVSGTTLVFL